MTRNENGPVGDDRGEMKNYKSFAERDVDAAVSGRVPADPELAAVRLALSLMKESLVMEPRTEVISSQAAQFAAAVPPTTLMPTVRQASPWRRRAGAAIAVAAISGFGLAGAAAADEAAPGDPMYGVDQALESVGIFDGGTPERLQEADRLASQGDVDGALELASDALESDGEVEAATGLRNAALAVASNSSGDDVRARVSEMLQWMAGQDSRGAEFGAAVSERARQISGNANENANANRNEKANGSEKANGNEKANGKANENANKSAIVDRNENAIGDGDENAMIPADPGSQGKAPETHGAPDQTVGRP